MPLDDIEDVLFWRELNDRRLNGTPLYFRPFIEAKAQRIAVVLTAIARAQDGAVIFHCGAGRDRAGLISLLLLSLAGATPAAIADHYELSLDRIKPLFDALRVQESGPSMRGVLQAHGTTVQAAIIDLLDDLDVAQLLRGAGVSAADIAALQARLLE
jgi:hypothetical protein